MYDLNTLVFDDGGIINSDITRSPDAKFWIPSISEWIKAAHFDPDRHGPGQPGYWLNHGQQDGSLQQGFPDKPGAETSTNIGVVWDLAPDVGAYSHVTSHYGLLDTAGGLSELTDRVLGSRVVQRGSDTVDDIFFLHDPIDFDPWFQTTTLTLRSSGLRLATVIPAPHTGMLFVFFVLGSSRVFQRR
ncbi:MAG: hypothetical protein AAGF47_04545 [Planctomycetota bacterium]